jgi:hypothetical protein
MVLLPLSACAAHFEVDCDVLEYRRLSCLLILRRTSTGNVHIRTVAGIGIEKEKKQATSNQKSVSKTCKILQLPSLQ